MLVVMVAVVRMTWELPLGQTELSVYDDEGNGKWVCSYK
jgi:hypothetical protein